MGMAEGFLVVVALGDSLTAGYRTIDHYAIDPRVPYPAQLEILIRNRLKGHRQAFVINAGINGDTTDGMLWRFRQTVDIEKPEIVVIWGGINDLGAANDPEQVMENLTKLYSLCGEIGATPVACTLTPTKRTSLNIRCLNELISVHASEKDLVLADLFSGLVDMEGNLRQEYSDDGVHLTQAGYWRVAEIVLDSLVPLIERWSSDQ
jgi:lysophospholipase L1-like esterase